MQTAASLLVGLGKYREVDLIPRVAAAGFEALDLHHFAFPDRPEWKDTASAAAELDSFAAAASDAGLDWVQGHGPFVVGPANHSEDAAMLERCAAALRDCGRLGIPWTVLHPFTFGTTWDRSDHARVLAANVEFVRRLLPVCEEARTGIALENTFDPDRPHARVFGSLPEDLCEILDALDNDLVGACWDTGHAHVCGIDQRAGIVSLGKRLKAVHVHDNDGTRDFHVMPYTPPEHGMDWDTVTAGLAEAGYEGALNLELIHAFSAAPDAIFDEVLGLCANIARHLADCVERNRAGAGRSSGG